MGAVSACSGASCLLNPPFPSPRSSPTPSTQLQERAWLLRPFLLGIPFPKGPRRFGQKEKLLALEHCSPRLKPAAPEPAQPPPSQSSGSDTPSPLTASEARLPAPSDGLCQPEGSGSVAEGRHQSQAERQGPHPPLPSTAAAVAPTRRTRETAVLSPSFPKFTVIVRSRFLRQLLGCSNKT